METIGTYKSLQVWQKAMNLGYISVNIDDVEVKACELSKMLTAMIKKFSPEFMAK